MRRLSLIMLAALVVLPTAAFAARSAPGDGVFELRAVNGTVGIVGKGALWGQMDKGSLRVVDTDPSDGTPPAMLVSGAERTRPVGLNATVSSGKDIHFRLTGGRYKLWFKGSGIDLTTVGVGNALLTGDASAFSTGSYALDGGKWTSVPLISLSVPFGAQPTPVPPPSSGP